MASLLTNILGTDSTYDAFLTKVNNLIAYRHTLDNATKTASYTAAVTDQLAVLNTSSGAITVTLPAVATSTNATLFFLVSDATNAVTFDANASETINGQTTLVCRNKYELVTLWCDGSAWWAFQCSQAQSRRAFQTKATTYTATIDDEVVLCDGSISGWTLTLPTAASAKGRLLIVKALSVSGGNITIDGNGSETIDGATTLVISTAYRAVTLCSDGSSWHVLSST